MDDRAGVSSATPLAINLWVGLLTQSIPATPGSQNTKALECQGCFMVPQTHVQLIQYYLYPIKMLLLAR